MVPLDSRKTTDMTDMTDAPPGGEGAGTDGGADGILSGIHASNNFEPHARFWGALVNCLRSLDVKLLALRPIAQ
jgi:hypothetical protein